MRTTRVFVCGIDRPSWASLAEAIAFLSAQMESIPPEYRDSATLGITVDDDVDWDDCGGSFPRLTICYERPSTPAEILGRANNDPLPLPGEDYDKLMQAINEYRARMGLPGAVS